MEIPYLAAQSLIMTLLVYWTVGFGGAAWQVRWAVELSEMHAQPRTWQIGSERGRGSHAYAVCDASKSAHRLLRPAPKHDDTHSMVFLCTSACALTSCPVLPCCPFIFFPAVVVLFPDLHAQPHALHVLRTGALKLPLAHCRGRQQAMQGS